MKTNNIENSLKTMIESQLSGLPKFLKRFLIWLISWIVFPKKVNVLYESASEKTGISFIEELFEQLNFTYYYSEKDYKRIPSEGRLVVVSNHPLGALDALALVGLVHSVRTDVKIVANNVLTNITNLEELIIPVNVYSQKADKAMYHEIEKSLLNEEVVIIFPAGMVSRTKYFTITDQKWNTGAVKIAKKYNAPILPVFIKAKNSFLFYLISLISKKFSMLLLPREILKKKKKSLTIKIGNTIPLSVFKSDVVSIHEFTKLLKKHVYRIGKGRRALLKEEINVIHPVDRLKIKKEIDKCELLLQNKNCELYFTDYYSSPNTIKEISRLREITFRKVGEGTGKKQDFDYYDFHYKHLVLWNPNELEIIGSYRIGIISEIIVKHGIEGIYNSEQFHFSDNFLPVLKDSLELGRSFIQQKYWRTMSLDLLWQGIGLILQNHPNIMYLFGSVSLSDNYSNFAKDLIVSYYKKWYSNPNDFAKAKNVYVISKMNESEIINLLIGNDFKEDYQNLKASLKNYGCSVPVLYRQYIDLCNYGGADFIDFNIDNNFSNSVDGLILVDLNQIKEHKLERYRKEKILVKETYSY